METVEELELLEHDQDKRKADELMSIIEDKETMPMLAEKEWHISLFGEIIQDDPIEGQKHVQTFSREGQDHHNKTVKEQKGIRDEHTKYRNVSELLFHPYNFDDKNQASRMVAMPPEMKDMSASHFDQMMFDIQKIYKKINSKLQLWLRFVKRNTKDDFHMDQTEMKQIKLELSELQCDVSTNSEICQIGNNLFKYST